eukprot:gene53224-72719_t
MPAYHLLRDDRSGITMVNIGVGPSNAKTITDHIAVLRPHVWIMLGHCAGLRTTQQLGDYVLAHGYVREDHVLDEDLPLVATNPCCFADEAFGEAHDALLCIAHSSYLESEDRPRSSPDAWMKPAKDMRLLFADLPEAIANTMVVAQFPTPLGAKGLRSFLGL